MCGGGVLVRWMCAALQTAASVPIISIRGWVRGGSFTQSQIKNKFKKSANHSHKNKIKSFNHNHKYKHKTAKITRTHLVSLHHNH